MHRSTRTPLPGLLRLRGHGARRLARLLVLAALATLPVIATAGGRAGALAPTPVFSPYVNFPVGVARSVAVADFTGDGRGDVLLTTGDNTTAGEKALWLFAQGATGKLDRLESFPVALGHSSGGTVAAGDFDNDGDTDAVVATGSSLALFLQEGGTLRPGPSTPVEGVSQVEVADLDGDGRVDLVASGTGGVAAVHGVGDGTFGAPAPVTAVAQLELEVGDVTGDGRPDVVTCAWPDVKVFAQQAGGGFSEPASYSGDVACAGIAVGDLTGDGRLDVGMAGGGNSPNARVDVFAQGADGRLASASTYSTHDLPGPAEIGDVNGDRRPDLVVYHNIFQAVGVHAQAPDHSLDPRRLYTAPLANNGGPKAMALGDVSGDGRNDVVIANDLRGLVVLVAQPAGPSTTTSSSLLPTTAPPGPPSGLFDAGQFYDVKGKGESVATGDFNGDGGSDAAVLTGFNFNPANDYKLFVFLQGPTGALERVIRFDTDVGGSDILNVAAGDLDGDAKTDLVVHGRYGIDVFLQRNGTFADRKYMEMPFAYDAALADVDLDGKADLVLSDPSIAIHRSMGAYSFAPPITVAVGEHSNTLVQDVTGDGRPDVVTEKWSVAPSAVELFVQRADGGFAPPTYHPTGGDELGAITAGDFTGDGRPDLAVVDDLGDYWYPETVKVLPGKQDGSFGPPVAYPADRAGDLKAADVNGDGRTDLVVAREWEKFGVFLQQPSGTFGAEYVTHVPLTDNGLGPLVVDDVSGDGRPDAVLANRNGGLTRVRNSGTAPPPATLQAPWSVWTQPGGSPLDGVGTWVGAVNDPAAGPGQVAPAYFFGQLFGFANSSALGMVGLVTQPAGKFAVFNVVEPNGTLRSAVVPFEWRAGRFYFLFVHQLGPGLWGAWAYDQSAASWTLLGSLSLPPTWGKLKGQTVTALLWAGPTAASCSAYPRADVVVHPAIGFAGGTQTTALQSGGGTNPGDCPAQNTVVSEVWSRYQVGTGGRT